jgi:hypothetical protein
MTSYDSIGIISGQRNIQTYHSINEQIPPGVRRGERTDREPVVGQIAQLVGKRLLGVV